MTSKARSSILWAMVVSLGAGCAANTTEIQPAYVSQIPYEGYNCDQIAAELKRVSRKAEEVGVVVDKMAEDDDAQMAVGLLFLWPTLFFLEGEDTPQTREYAELRGQLKALEDVSVKKGCRVGFRHAAQSTGTTGSSDKLEALKLLYRDGAITEEEYLEKRRTLMDQEIAEEVQALKAEQGQSAESGTSTAAAQSQTQAMPSGKVRVAILPFAQIQNSAMQSGTARREVGEYSHQFVRGQKDLELVYSYQSRNFDPGLVGNPELLWTKGHVSRKPRPEKIYELMERLDADMAITFFTGKRTAAWGSTDQYKVTAYIYDLGQRQEYQRDADELDFKKVFKSLFTRAVGDRGGVARIN